MWFLLPTHVLGVHSRTVLSSEAEASRCPAGENSTPVTANVWPTKRIARVLGFRFHTMTAMSAELVAEEQKTTTNGISRSEGRSKITAGFKGHAHTQLSSVWAEVSTSDGIFVTFKLPIQGRIFLKHNYTRTSTTCSTPSMRKYYNTFCAQTGDTVLLYEGISFRH